MSRYLLLFLLFASNAWAADVLKPCEPDTEEYRQAAQAYDQLDKQILALTPAQDAVPAWAAMHRLLTQPCFKMALFDLKRRSSLSNVDTLSGFALKSWWNAGGDRWLRSYLDLARDRSIVLPPDLREVLTLDHAPNHPLSPMLCRVEDETCGRETKAWQLRAVRMFEAHELYWGRSEKVDCLEVAKQEAPEHQFDTWRTCEEGQRLATTALPLGQFRAPKDGWFVLIPLHINGSGCWKKTFMELATGAVHVVEHCWERNENGKPKDVDSVHTGRLSLDNMREAVWMTLLQRHLDWNVQTEGVELTVADELPLEIPTKTVARGSGMRRGVSGADEYWWLWLRAGTVQASGAMARLHGDSWGLSVADELLDVAEATFAPEEKCLATPPLLPKTWPESVPAPSGLKIDDIRKVYEFHWNVLKQNQREKRCAK